MERTDGVSERDTISKQDGISQQDVDSPLHADSQGEGWIAALLGYGTWMATAVIAAGLGWEFAERLGAFQVPGVEGADFVRVGIGLFILLPIARVFYLFGKYLRSGDVTYLVISGLVLAIIGCGIVLGLWYS